MKEIKFGKLTVTIYPEDMTAIITDCEKDVTEINIPEKIDNAVVTGIGEFAFERCTLLKKVTLPDNPELFWGLNEGFTIEGNAFNECESLEEINLPRGLFRIGWGAFRFCKSLKEIHIPDSSLVDPYAFCHCEGLVSVNPIDMISEGVFSHCYSLATFPVKEGADKIGEDAFEHCYALKEAYIPESVLAIEPLAFRNCHALEKVSFASPDYWYYHDNYTFKETLLDLSDPKVNAKELATMDFDDGCGGWTKEDKSYVPKKSIFENF